MTITTSIETITPEAAEAMLQTNERNRPMSQKRVASFIEAMNANEWHMNGQSIAFDVSGKLIDGQHRLSAIANSGLSQTMIVVRGLNGKAQETTDIGMRRSAAQMLSMDGLKYPAIIATAINLIQNDGDYTKARGQASRTGSPYKVASWISDHPGAVEHLQQYASVYHDLKALLPVSMAVGYRYLFNGVDGAAAYEFWRGLVELDFDHGDDPRRVLYKRLNAAKGIRNTNRINNITIAQFIVKTWSAYRKGEKMQRLLPSKHGNFPSYRD